MSESSDYDSKTGVLGNQRSLAEVIEMIHSAQQIHRSVLNLPFKLPEAAESEAKTLQEDLEELEYGNKLAILGGDYLLANACTNLANLNNTYVTELIALSIAEFAQSEFIGKRDVQGRCVVKNCRRLHLKRLSYSMPQTVWTTENVSKWTSNVQLLCSTASTYSIIYSW